MELQVHPVQTQILRVLLFNPSSRFRDLNKSGLPNDHFTFHLSRLVKEGLVIKNSGKYYLSDKGKEFANRMDTENLVLEKQAKLSIALHPVRKVNGKLEHLIHHRLKEPFYGWYGSLSGKIKWGENPLLCAQRELLEETGLTGDFVLKGIVHYHHIHKDGRFLEDKYFWIYRVENTQGNLKEKVEEGENIWMGKSEFIKLKNVFGNFQEMTQVIDSPHLLYLERTKMVDSY